MGKPAGAQRLRVAVAIDKTAVVGNDIGFAQKLGVERVEVRCNRVVRAPRAGDEKHAQFAHAREGGLVALGDNAAVVQERFVHMACDEFVARH